MVADSKTKLLELVDRKTLLYRCMERSTSELNTFVKKYERELWEARGGSQQFGQREKEGIEDSNEAKEMSSSTNEENHKKQSMDTIEEGSGYQDEPEMEEWRAEDVLRKLLNSEERLRRLKCNENDQQLWERSIESVRKWWPESDGMWALGQRLEFEYVECSMRMLWNSYDIVWLLGCGFLNGEPWWILQQVRDKMEQVYPTEFRVEQHPASSQGKEQLLVTFQRKLEQWQDDSESFRQKARDLLDLLEYWPKHHQVRNIV